MNKIFDITVVIPTYNNIEYLEEMLESINNSKQNYTVEVLVGIDGCKKTLDFVKANFFDENVKFLFFGQNGGPYTIKNTLVQKASAEKIIFFDSDDLMSENLIPKIIKTLDLFKICKFRYKNFIYNKTDNYKQSVSYGEGVFGITKSLFLEMNGFEPWICAADSDFWGRIYKSNVKARFINEILMLRRIHNNQLTKRNDTGMRSTLRAHYWKLSKSKRGNGNPSFLSVREYLEIHDVNSERLKFEQINILRKKEVLIESVKSVLISNNLIAPPSKPKKQPPVELNYDLVNKLMTKKLNQTQEQEKKPNLILDRQNLFDLKRKKV